MICVGRYGLCWLFLCRMGGAFELLCCVILDRLVLGLGVGCYCALRFWAFAVFFCRFNDWGPVRVVQIFFCAARSARFYM